MNTLNSSIWIFEKHVLSRMYNSLVSKEKGKKMIKLNTL